MRWLVLVLGLALLWPCVVGAQSMATVYIEVITPATDDLGHYVPVSQRGPTPVMGAVAADTALAGITVNGSPAVLFPLTYPVRDAPDGLTVTGFRALVTLQPSDFLGVVVTDGAGGTRTADYLPDQLTVLQRLTFWRQWRPTDPYVALRLAVANGQAGNYDLALTDFDTFVRTEARTGLAQQLRGLMYWQMGRLPDALADLQAVVNATPDVYPARVDLARLLRANGDETGATAQLQQAVALAPDSAEAHVLLGQCYCATGNVEQGSAEFALAQQADANMATADYELGMLQSTQGDADGALASLGQSVLKDPRNGAAHAALASVRFGRGQYDLAWREVERAQRWGGTVSPDFLDALSAKMKEPHTVGPR